MSKNKELRLGVRFLKFFEGYEPKEYLDSELIPSIGIGRNLDIFPLESGELDAEGNWPEQDAFAWALTQLGEARRGVVIQQPWVVKAPYAIRIILTDMAYNIGVSGLMSFKKMLEAMKDEDYNLAARELRDSKYYNQVGRRSKLHFLRLQELATFGE
jgi:lysozyme